jgi:NitT/TauT family transport system ATP-binding protein
MDIEIDNLTKEYEHTQALSRFSCQIPEGSRAVLMGPSGCGKTTLLRLMLGLEKPDSGTMTGVPSRCSVVFQENRLCEELSAVDNIRLVLPRHVTKDEVAEHLRLVGIEEESLQQPVSTFSGGMKRRVAVVRAMLAESELVLLDEPCNGLDDATKQLVVAYIKKMQGKRTMLLVTHDTEEAVWFDGHIWKMDKE